MSEIKSGRGYVYSIQYHIVWCVKYRHKILTSKIEKSLIEILRKIANDNEFEIIEIKLNKSGHLLRGGAHGRWNGENAMASGARSYTRPRRARLIIKARAPAAIKARAGT